MKKTEPVTRKKKTARFVEIAVEAGVSPSTVDRVLNQRGSVSPATTAKVIAAARQLGIPRLLPDTKHGLKRLDIVLPDNTTPFFCRLNLAFQRAVQMLDKRIVVKRLILPEHDEDAIIRAILQPPYKRQGLIVTVPDTLRVRAALERVIGEGLPLVTMVTDLPGIDRRHYAGIDNYRAGRTAGFLLGRQAKQAGRVLLLSSRNDYRSHIERTSGCRDVLTESFPQLTCDHVASETDDDPDKCYLAVIRALKHHPDIVGIYNSGAGSNGIEAALRKSGLAGRIFWVGHEPTDDHRKYIQQGTMDWVIDQDPDGQAISALQHLLYACGQVETAPPDTVHEFRLYCAENIWPRQYLPNGTPAAF